MPDHGRVTGRANLRFPRRNLERSDVLAHRVADADALEIREADRPVLPPGRLARMWEAENGGERRRLTRIGRDEAGRALVNVAAQIMMRREQFPRRAIDTKDFEVNRWPSPKPPPGELARMWLVDPIRLKPVEDIVMTGHRDEFLTPTPQGLGDGGRADLGDGRSTMLVNSSMTAKSGSSASARARLTRNCSPLERI